MSVFRVEKNKNYTVMSNQHLQDRNLTLKAKGLLSLMLSLPDDWDYSLRGLKRICSEAIGTINGAIQELERNGYIVRHQDRDSKGRLGPIIYTIYENPQKNAEISASEPCVKNPHTDNPHTGKPHAENKTQQNTNKQSTNQPSTKRQKSTFLLTSRTREEEQQLNDIKQFITERIGRDLFFSESRLCSTWISNRVDLELIQLAVEDNLFRKDRFELKYVQETLDKWFSLGIDTPVKARNHILDSHVENVANLAAQIAERSYNDELRESILEKNEARDLQGTRDYMIDLYRRHQYSSLLGFAQLTYHKDILDYLPEEIRIFIQEHTA